jgi:hypothetical protein
MRGAYRQRAQFSGCRQLARPGSALPIFTALVLKKHNDPLPNDAAPAVLIFTEEPLN